VHEPIAPHCAEFLNGRRLAILCQFVEFRQALERVRFATRKSPLVATISLTGPALWKRPCALTNSRAIASLLCLLLPAPAMSPRLSKQLFRVVFAPVRGSTGAVIGQLIESSANLIKLIEAGFAVI
jgi:hypothetical protein